MALINSEISWRFLSPPSRGRTCPTREFSGIFGWSTTSFFLQNFAIAQSYPASLDHCPAWVGLGSSSPKPESSRLGPGSPTGVDFPDPGRPSRRGFWSANPGWEEAQDPGFGLRTVQPVHGWWNWRILFGLQEHTLTWVGNSEKTKSRMRTLRAQEASQIISHPSFGVFPRRKREVVIETLEGD